MTGTVAESAVEWHWRPALFGAVCALPGAAVALHDLEAGAAMAVGVLPAVIVGVAPTRRGRLALPAVGVLTGVPMALGALVSGIPLLAIALVFGLAFAGVALSRTEILRRRSLGTVLTNLGVPLVGIGLSYPAAQGLATAALMVAGSVSAFLFAMLLPREPADTTDRTAPPVPGWGYAVQLGATGATAAAIGFALHLDHVGWVCGAALLVMRPDRQVRQLRMVGRIGSVFVGAVTAALLVDATTGSAAYAIAIVAALAAAAGTHGSRWYVTPAFTTFLVILLLSAGNPAEAGQRVPERIIETLVGVGVAAFWGIVVPALVARRSHPQRVR